MKSGRGEDQPDALLGSVEVMFMKGAEPHSSARTHILRASTASAAPAWTAPSTEVRSKSPSKPSRPLAPGARICLSRTRTRPLVHTPSLPHQYRCQCLHAKAGLGRSPVTTSSHPGTNHSRAVRASRSSRARRHRRGRASSTRDYVADRLPGEFAWAREVTSCAAASATMGFALRTYLPTTARKTFLSIGFVR
jgi:hypothetical protein